MNSRLLSDREMTQKSRNVPSRDSYNRMLDSHQSLGSHLRSSQAMQRRQSYPYPNNSIIQDTKIIEHMPQNHPGPNNSIQGTNINVSHQNYPDNSIQGLYHENNISGAKTQPMVPLASSSNNNGSLRSRAGHGGVSLLSLPRDPPVNMGSQDIPPSLLSHVGSAGNSSFNNNVVGLQGYTNDFSNAPKTIFDNQNNLPYHLFSTNNSLHPIQNMNHCSPFKDVSTHMSHNMNNSSMFKDCNPMSTHHLNNSSLFKDSNPYPRVDVNSFQSVKDANMPSPSLLPTQTQTSLNRFGSSVNFKDLAHERTMKRPLGEVERPDIIGNASKMPRMSSTPPNFYEENEPDEEKELLLVKDVKIQFSPPEIMIDAADKDEENIDLSLHL